MKNRDLPACPNKRGVSWIDEYLQYQHVNAYGLSKLEYAAIHIFSAQVANGKYSFGYNEAIHKANNLFDELEKQDD